MIFLKKNNKIPEGYKFYLIDELVFLQKFSQQKNSIINDIEKLTEKFIINNYQLKIKFFGKTVKIYIKLYQNFILTLEKFLI